MEAWEQGYLGHKTIPHPLSHIRSLALYLSMVQAIQCPDRTKLMLPVQSRPYFKLCNAVACVRNVRMHAILASLVPRPPRPAFVACSIVRKAGEGLIT